MFKLDIHTSTSHAKRLKKMYPLIHWYENLVHHFKFSQVGHNLGHQHSGKTDTYDDKSGMMGYSCSSDNGPIMCFNAAKSWQMNWCAFKSIVVEPATNNGTECFEQDLYGIFDFDKENANYVLVKINDRILTDQYNTFNSKKRIYS